MEGTRDAGRQPFMPQQLDGACHAVAQTPYT